MANILIIGWNSVTPTLADMILMLMYATKADNKKNYDR